VTWTTDATTSVTDTLPSLRSIKTPRRFWNANTHYHDLILASLPPGADRVLDVGCGDGILLADLINAGVRQVVGLDTDRGVLERARTRHGDSAIEWLEGDVYHPALMPGSFDAVVSVAALHHMDAARALKRFAQLVRPGGTVAVIGLAAREWWDIPFEAAGLVAKYAMGAIYGHWAHSAPQCWPPPLTYREMRAISRQTLPGARYRRHLLNRYSIIWSKT
jgi:SAM-dependent methyltransferase